MAVASSTCARSSASRHERLIRFLALTLLIFSSLLLGAGLLWERVGPERELFVSPDAFSEYRGEAYAVRIDPFPAKITHASRMEETRLVLYEDGIPLSHATSGLLTLITEGNGQYAAFGRWLLFAPSDNSDPRSNGRHYEAHLLPGLPLVALKALAIVIVLTGGLLLASSMRWLNAGDENSSAQDWAQIGGPAFWIALLSAVWGFLVLGSAPQIVTNGDGGNVASIIAAQLQPDRFANDIVFGDPSSFAFYQTLLIPLTRVMTRLTGDVGQAYMSLSGPLVFIQMFGFFLLGRRLFQGILAPALLALATIVPIFVFNGELWGMLGSPLTRSFYAALLPWLLLAALAPFSKLRALVLMAVCGLSVYIHPVSAPTGAFGILAMLFVAKPLSTSWTRHTGFIFVCGVVFLGFALPFAVAFSQAFPGGNGSDGSATAVAQEMLRGNVGPQYYDVSIVLSQFLAHFWLGILAGLIALVLLRRERRLVPIVAFAVGVAATSIGISALDQAVATIRGADPIQIDLIRNIRFLVPAALILVFWAFARAMRQNRLFAAPAVAVTAALWMVFPTPLGSAIGERIVTRHQPPHDWLADAQAALRHLAELPPGAVVLPLPHEATSEGLDLANLAIRYSAFQQVAFQSKDMNFLAYSGNDAILTWNETRLRLDNAASSPPQEAAALLRGVLEDRGVTHLLAFAPGHGGLRGAALEMGETIAVEGDFVIVAVEER